MLHGYGRRNSSVQILDGNIPPLKTKKSTWFFLLYSLTAGLESCLYVLGSGGVVISVTAFALYIGVPLFLLGVYFQAKELWELNKEIRSTNETLNNTYRKYRTKDLKNLKKLDNLLRDVELYGYKNPSYLKILSNKIQRIKARENLCGVEDNESALLLGTLENKIKRLAEYPLEINQTNSRPFFSPPIKINRTAIVRKYMFGWIFGIATIVTFLYLLAEIAAVAAFLMTLLSPPLLPVTITMVLLLGGALALGYIKLSDKNLAIHEALNKDKNKIKTLERSIGEVESDDFELANLDHNYHRFKSAPNNLVHMNEFRRKPMPGDYKGKTICDEKERKHHMGELLMKGFKKPILTRRHKNSQVSGLRHMSMFPPPLALPLRKNCVHLKRQQRANSTSDIKDSGRLNRKRRIHSAPTAI